MQSTRSRILEYLSEHPRSSALEISRYLGLTSSNIRYHLDLLQEQGRVQVTGTRSPGGAGRPILLYNLSPPSLGNNIYPLLRDLMAWIWQSPQPRRTIGDIAQRLADQTSPLPINRVKRYNQAVAFLNQRHYRAKWEARPEGPRVFLRHCPYQELALDTPAICQLDQELLSQLLGREMSLTRRRQFGEDPFSPCIFNPASTQEDRGPGR